MKVRTNKIYDLSSLAKVSHVQALVAVQYVGLLIMLLRTLAFLYWSLKLPCPFKLRVTEIKRTP